MKNDAQHEQHQIQWSTFVWITWYIGPIERLACEIFSLTLDFMSFYPIMNSNIFLGIRACSGNASASLLKEKKGLAISVGVLSLSPGSYIFMMIIITISFGDWRFKAVFWWEICRAGTLWNAAGHDPKGYGYRRHHQNWPLISSDETAAAEEWCFFVQSSRNQKIDNGAFRWIMLKLVQGFSEARHMLTMRVFLFIEMERYRLKSV